jgi:uncharacterized protein (DUF302 family)
MGEKGVNMNDPTKSGTVPEIEGVTTRPSSFSVEQTLERLRESVQSRNLKIFAQIDHSDEAEQAGLAMQPAHVLIFGSPKAGTPLMLASPLLALELPLKALVWQDAAGHVWVSYDSSDYLAGRFAVPSELVKNIAGVDAVIAAAL